jgi:hypothetical protein
MKSSQKVPILFVAFIRSDHATKVFNVIKQQKPTKLFMAVDGPRKNYPSDIDNINKIRELVNNIDWECDLKTRFLDNNLGCKHAVSSAISWFFEHVEYGIILEEDCVPNLSFFNFCSELLERYKDDERIMQISGNNFIKNKEKIKESYYFSTLNDIWGWATWQRAWQHFDLLMTDYEEYKKRKLLETYVGSKDIALWLEIYLDRAASHSAPIWSSQWSYAMARNNGLIIAPKYNLVRNIGFDGSGTNSQDKSWNYYSEFKTEEIGKLTHPKFISPNRVLDRLRFSVIRITDPIFTFKNIVRRFLTRIKLSIKKISDG